MIKRRQGLVTKGGLGWTRGVLFVQYTVVYIYTEQCSMNILYSCSGGQVDKKLLRYVAIL